MRVLHQSRMLQLIKDTYEYSTKKPYGCVIYNSNGDKVAMAFGDNLSPINHAEIKAINQCAGEYNF